MLNPYFQQGARSEQNLVQDLINEQLRMYGVEIYYLPRKYMTENTVIREVIQSKFDDAYPLEAYIDNYDGYAENPVLLSKFGIEAQNEITLVISKERWETYIQPLMKNESNVKLTTRPKEGDIVYFPLGDRLFEIKYVEHEKPFYQLQKNYTYTLRCELFRYEDEVIDTGVSEIDDELTGDSSDGTTEDGISTLLGPTQTLTMVGTAVQATAITGLVNGYVRYINMTNRGGGYTSPPVIGFSSAPSGGVTAVGVASMIGGIEYCNLNVNANQKSVQSVNLINPGSGYTVAPNLTFTSDTGSGAKATAGIGTTGGVGIVTVSTSGSGYVTAPTVTFSTPKHVGAAATAILDTPMVGGGVSITSAPISIGSSSYLFPGGTTGGVFYKAAPTVTFSLPSGGGFTAEATATMGNYANTGGTVASVGLTTGGRFYDAAPIVTISHPGTSYAAATIGLAGTAINASSVAFTTTGRAYTTRPTVTIGTGIGTHTPIVTAVGIATISPITGIVTAVGFNTQTDPWCVGTGATIGLGYTVTPTISFSGATAASQATATATIDLDGQVNAVSIASSGFGYDIGSTATVTIAAPDSNIEQFRALGFATIRYNSIETSGTIGIGSTYITGITTTNVVVGDRVRLLNRDAPIVNFIPTGSYVSQIGISTIYISSTATNVSVATSTFEFGMDECGIVTGIGVTYGGGGYLEPPTVSISNTVGDKNYVEIIAGIHTATGISTISSAGIVTSIWVGDSGYGYVLTPTITIASPTTSSTGNFIFNEIVTGGTSGTTARVRSWNNSTSVLEVSSVTGRFILGESVTGGSSGAVHELRVLNEMDLGDGYADNFNIETEADAILDFTEKNPFGTP